MVFQSLSFLGFFAVVFFVYWTLPSRFRWAAALVASAVFYLLFGLQMAALLIFCTLLSYGAALCVEQCKSHRKVWFCAWLIACLLPLLFYKYYWFLTENLFAPLAGFFAFPQFEKLLPIGISFYTFKMVSYLIEVYRGHISAERHLGYYALYLTFFTEITAGPIQRPNSLLPQIKTPRVFSGTHAITACEMILWGLFKKLVIADNLGYYIQNGFSKPDNVYALSLVVAAVLYAVQIYCDFSGYSDLAVGFSALLGFEVPQNFNSPYFSASLKEFWSRWHISLSTWLRDYVYIPLGGNRKGKLRKELNILLTFCISGLWHGAGFSFLAWGALHGAGQVMGNCTRPLRRQLRMILHIGEQNSLLKAWQILFTFAFVTAAWVFFTSPTIADALRIFARMGSEWSFTLRYVKEALALLALNKTMILRMTLCIGLLFFVDWRTKEQGFSAWVSQKKPAFQILFCYLLVVSVLFWGAMGGGQFIYFQF